MSSFCQRRPAAAPEGAGVGVTTGEPKTALTHDLQTDTRLVRDTSPTANSLTAPATVPAQEASPAQPKPEGWKGLSYWLATADRGVVESVLCTIRDDFMTKYAQPQSNSAAAAQQNAQAAGKWRQVPSSDSTPAEDQTDDLLLRETVLREAVMYGEMVQAVYDTLQTKDKFSKYYGYCAPGVMLPGDQLAAAGEYTTLGEGAKTYRVLKQIEADSGAYKLVVKTARNYVGFIAESQPDPKDHGVDIAIVYRGTITKDDWLQDSKVMKVRWRNGEQPAPPPDETLTAFPFYSHFGTALAVSIGTFVLLSSTITAGPINAVGKLAARVTGWCAAQHVHPYTEVSAAFDLLGSVWKHTLGAFNWIFECILHVDTGLVNTKLLGGSLMAGVAVYIGWGIVSAKLDNPNEWRGNVKKLRGVIGAWMLYGIITWKDSLIGEPRSDPRVSFGFKEMYCDALMYPGSEQNSSQPCSLTRATSKTAAAADGEKELPAPPRLTVYQTLTDVLNRYDKVGGPWVRSITVTGHSLGGALASICGFDLATKITWSSGTNSEVEFPNDPDLDDDYKATREARKAFEKAIKKLEKNQVPVPKVAVVSFAAPRVGDTNYAKALGHRTLMDPRSVLEPYGSGFWSNVAVKIRDRLWQALKMPWYWTALRQMQQQYAQPSPDAFGRAPAAAASDAAAGGDGDGSQAAAAQSGPGVGMLRLVNTHDVVTKLPAAVPIPGFYYVHGGYELLFNSYAVSYFKKDWWGAEIGNRHNLEMYLHLLDSSRDKTLVNKSADLLTDDQRVLGCWWDPIPHKGLTRYRLYGPREPVDGTAAAGQEDQAREMGYSRMDGKEGAAAAGQEVQVSAAAAGQQQDSKME